MSTARAPAIGAMTPEARKTLGVYYTPSRVIDYIVRKTVGKLLPLSEPSGGRVDSASLSSNIARGRAPVTRDRRAGHPLRICDPACGTGLFLLAAYQYLLDWYAGDNATGDPQGRVRAANPPIEESVRNAPSSNGRSRGIGSPLVDSGRRHFHRLTLEERRRILLEHIYGVDIDAQAVETAKHSLLGLLLEGKPKSSDGRSLRRFEQRILTELSDNIKCGNALIGPDFHDNVRPTASTKAERRRIKAFDWRAEFPNVFHQGAMVSSNCPSEPGRPRPRLCSGFDIVFGNPPYLSYSGRQAVALSDAERAYYARRYQSAGWPTAHGLFIERAARDLSNHFVGFIVPDQVGHLPGYHQVRAVLDRYSRLSEVRYWGEGVFKDAVTPAVTFIADRLHRGRPRVYADDNRPVVLTRRIGEPWIASDCNTLLQKLQNNSVSLGRLVADPGVHTGNCAKRLIYSREDAPKGCVPILEGRRISRYQSDGPNRMLRIAYEPATGEYFTVRPLRKYTDAAFLIRQTAAFPIVGPRQGADYFRNSLLALYSPEDMDVHYLVGLLNSRLLRYVYRERIPESRQRAFPQVKVRSLRTLPIRPIHAADAADRKHHDRMVALVRQMLDLHRKLGTARTSREQAAVQDRISTTDRRIDRLVYELYGLSASEIRKVEATTL